MPGVRGREGGIGSSQRAVRAVKLLDVILQREVSVPTQLSKHRDAGYSVKSERKYKLWTLGDNEVSL